MQRVFLIIGVCLALLFVAGCGDDSSTTSGTEATTEAESPQGEDTTASEEAAGEEEAAEEESEPELPKVTVPKGPPPKKLVIEDLKKGSGATAKAGDEVSVDYVGVVYATQKLFDANWEGAEPFAFTLGAQQVIKGWDQGIQGMKVGGERKLIIPPALAYGNEGIYPSIPPNSTLVFLTKLVAVN